MFLWVTNTICVKRDLLGLLQRRVLCERPCGDGNVFVGDNTTKAKRCEKEQWHCSNQGVNCCLTGVSFMPFIVDFRWF